MRLLAVYQGSNPWTSILPNPGVKGSLADKFPIAHYALDYYIDTGITHSSGWFDAAGQWIGSMFFQAYALVTSVVLDIFSLAFNNDIFPTALPQVQQATQHIQDSVTGPYVFLAVGMLGVWAGLKALSNPTQVIEKFVAVLACTLFAFALLANPDTILGGFYRATNDMAVGAFSAVQGADGDATSGQAKARDALFKMAIYRPWVAAEFGGFETCTDASKVNSHGFPVQVSADTPGAICRNNIASHNGYGGYANRFLAQAPNSPERQAEYDALRTGTPPDNAQGYRVDKHDAIAVDVMQEGGSSNRLILVAVTLIGGVGMLLLLGALALAMFMAAAGALLLFAFTPVALFFGIVPGGERAFAWWLQHLVFALALKFVVSVVLITLVALTLAIDGASGPGSGGIVLGWILQSVFYWTIFKKRKTVMGLFGKAASEFDGKRIRYPGSARRQARTAMNTGSAVAKGGTAAARGAGLAAGAVGLGAVMGAQAVHGMTTTKQQAGHDGGEGSATVKSTDTPPPTKQPATPTATNSTRSTPHTPHAPHEGRSRMRPYAPTDSDPAQLHADTLRRLDRRAEGFNMLIAARTADSKRATPNKNGTYTTTPQTDTAELTQRRQQDGRGDWNDAGDKPNGNGNDGSPEHQ